MHMIYHIRGILLMSSLAKPGTPWPQLVLLILFAEIPNVAFVPAVFSFASSILALGPVAIILNSISVFLQFCIIYKLIRVLSTLLPSY